MFLLCALVACCVTGNTVYTVLGMLAVWLGMVKYKETRVGYHNETCHESVKSIRYGDTSLYSIKDIINWFLDFRMHFLLMNVVQTRLHEQFSV